MENQFEKDKRGRWWYRAPGNQIRKRAWSRWCPVCRKRFVSANPRVRTCSHTCGAKAMHGDRPITTIAQAAELKNSDNPRYSRDDKGQWWYTPGGPKIHGRSRAFVMECEYCHGKYLACIFHRRKSRFCSKSCGLKAICEANPDRYKGEKGSNWKGGKQTVRGYVWLWSPDHPSRAQTKKPYVLEHRLVMEKQLGRYLLAHEQVHHKNGIRDDNRPENLELWVKQQPSGARVHEQQHCPTCSCFH